MSEAIYIVTLDRPAIETTCYEVTVPSGVLADHGYEVDAAITAVIDGCRLDGAAVHVVGEPTYRPDSRGTWVELHHEPASLQR